MIKHRKVSISFTICLFFTLFSQNAVATDYQIYERSESDGKTHYRERTNVAEISLGTQTREKSIFFDYKGHAIIKFNKVNKDGLAYTETVNVWFNSSREAREFVTHMNAHPEQDLYYNIYDNPLNREVRWNERCIVNFMPIFCQNNAATIVNSKNIVGAKLYIYNPRTQAMVRADSNMDSEKLALDETQIHDGNRQTDGVNQPFSHEQRQNSVNSGRSVGV